MKGMINMAISTFKVFLMSSDTQTGTFTKLIDIKEFPDLGGEPEMIEITTTSDRRQRFINGIQSLEAFTFTANYDVEEYERIEAYKGQDRYYAVWIGGTENADGTITPTGEDGKYTFGGQLSIFVNGGGINEVINMTITIAPSTDITFSKP